MGGQQDRKEPGGGYALALAVGVHLALALFLFFGVRWNTQEPAPMVAELWSELPTMQQPEPPKPEPPKPEPPKPEPPKPEPPKPEPPKPEPPKPKVEPPKPDIALEEEKKKKEAERKKKEEEEKRRAEDKRKEEQKRKEDEKRRLAQEAEAQREYIRKQLGDIKPPPKTMGPVVGQPAPGDPAAKAGYVDKIRAKIRGNIVMPPDLPGNPEAQFQVRQLPDGTVVSVKLLRSSGVPAYDEAVERAIQKSSPLPLPDKRELFESTLNLKFRPVE